MKAVWIVLIKTLLVPLYKQHAGLLIVVFFLMFGVVESSQIIHYHEALIHGMLNSKVFLILVMSSWMLYCIKSLAFLLKTSADSSYQFLNTLSILHSARSYWYYFGITFLSFAPVLVYTSFIYGIAIQYHYWGAGALVFICQLTLLLIMAGTLNHSLRNQHKSPILSIPSLKIPSFNNLFGIYTNYLVGHEKVALLLSKSLSLVLLYLVRETLDPEDDNRILGITWLFAVMAHILIIPKLKTFEDHQLTWQLGLPIPITQRYLTYAKVYLVMMMPELLLLATSIGNGLTLGYFIALIVFSIGFFTFIHSYLYKRSRNKERFVNYLLWLFLFSFISILSKLIWIVAIFYVIVSYYLLQKRFFTYEKDET
jgi:hypothetical protein